MLCFGGCKWFDDEGSVQKPAASIADDSWHAKCAFFHAQIAAATLLKAIARMQSSLQPMHALQAFKHKDDSLV
jgi:hypothetical protein